MSEPRVKGLVAEDEPVLRADLRARLAALWPALDIVGAENGIEALAMFEAHQPQVLFLDVEMPGMDGLQVAQNLSGRCHIVFITAYDSHAIAAFEAGAIDYVLKPYDDARLATAIRRLKDRVSSAPMGVDELIQRLALNSRPKEHLRWITASRGAEIDLIMVNDVAYFMAEDKYTTVFTKGGEATIRRSIKDLAQELDPNRFWRIHRSTIVNIEAIQTVSKSLAGVTVKLKSRPARLPVSDAYRYLFKHM